MYKTIYEEGLYISRNFDRRSKTDTERLYQIIKHSVEVAQGEDEEEKDKDDAVGFLVTLYEPLIKKCAARTFCFVSKSVEFCDVLQEAYVTFILLLSKYDSSISSFSYYIGLMLNQRMSRWAEKESVYDKTNIVSGFSDQINPHPRFHSAELVDSYLNGFVLIQDYVDFITERASKQSRSTTVKEVCTRYFLGSATCSQIAGDLNISYHAVYEIIGKIKTELRDFFSENIFSTYMITSTGEYKEKLCV